MSELTTEQRLERVEAYIAISNVMGKYVFHRMNENLPAVTALFTSREDLRVEMPSGIYTGPDAAYRCFEVDHAVDPNADPALVIHDINTPVIEIAADCKTAKGIWISPGLATASMPTGKKGLWAWVKYDCDFIREDAGWKIWHMRKYEIFTVPTDKSWADENPMAMMAPPKPADGTAAAPPPKPLRSNDLPAGISTKYNPKKRVPAIPVPPEPFETWPENK